MKGMQKRQVRPGQEVEVLGWEITPMRTMIFTVAYILLVIILHFTGKVVSK